MAVVVFDDGNGTAIWSDLLNWVGGALPLAADTADLNADCALDMSDIVAVLDVGANTFTMQAGNNLTGLTATLIGTGTINMAAGCQMTWNGAGDYDVATIDIIARGTSGNRCLIDNVGAGRVAIDGSGTWDVEYTDLHSLYRFSPKAHVRLVGCDVEGAATSQYCYFGGQAGGGNRLILQGSYFSNFDGSFGGTGFGVVYPQSYRLIENCTWGEDIDGNPQANATDWHLGYTSKGAILFGRNIRLTSGTQITFQANVADYAPGVGVLIDNFGYADGTGTRGIGYANFACFQVERAVAAAKAGDFGIRFSPKTGCGTADDKNADSEIYVPIATGDDISVSVYSRRTGMTNDCAKVVIDPEEAWFTSDTSAEVLTNINTWYELTASAAGAGGVGAVGMCRIVLRVDEVDAAHTVDFADMVVTVT